MGDKIALGAMIVAIVAAFVAIWQASEARGARKVAREQADIAKDALAQTTKQSAAAERSATAADFSANAADRSAGAAEDQVVEARKAVRAAEAQVAEARRAVEVAEAQLKVMESQHLADMLARHETDGPQFTLTVLRRAGKIHPIEVEMDSGPEMVRVQAFWNIDTSAPEPEGGLIGAVWTGSKTQDMVRGRKLTLDVQMPRPNVTMTVYIHLVCEEPVGRKRQWTRTYSRTLEPPGDPLVSFG